METQKTKAIAVDGTITDKDRKICVSAIEAIREAEKIGIPTIIVTGNIFFYAYATSTLIGTTGGIVAENGGVISESVDDVEKIKVLGDFEKVQKAFDYLKSILSKENMGIKSKWLMILIVVYLKLQFIELLMKLL